MTTTLLDIRELHLSYGRQQVLKGVRLQLARGEWLCLLGPNGSGKTTVVHCIGGRLAANQGDVQICGHSIRAAPRAAKRRLGFGCAPEQLPGLLTGRQCLEVYAFAKELERLDEDVMQLAEQLGFSRFMDRFVDTYSLGTRQKLCILLALLGDPELIVLDEAFNGLDPASGLVLKRHLQQRLSAGRCAVLLATHSLDIVEHYADRAALLLEGRIVRQWSRHEIAVLREQGENGFESALAAVSEA